MIGAKSLLDSRSVAAGIPDRNDAICRRVWQRLKQNGIHGTEDRGCGADAQSQSKNCDQGEARTPQKFSNGETNIFDYRVHALISNHHGRFLIPKLNSATSQFEMGNPHSHSYLSATSGSTLVARRAGMQHAISATRTRPMETVASVSASVAVTPKRKLTINRVSPTAPASPSVTPNSTGTIPFLTSSLSTSAARAPSAMRMPISCVRCVTA